jgi:DNA-binding transcriptional regulator YiaG
MRRQEFKMLCNKKCNLSARTFRVKYIIKLRRHLSLKMGQLARSLMVIGHAGNE